MTTAGEQSRDAPPADASLPQRQLAELRAQLKQRNERIAAYETQIRRNEDLLAQVFEFAHSLLRCPLRPIKPPNGASHRNGSLALRIGLAGAIRSGVRLVFH